MATRQLTVFQTRDDFWAIYKVLKEQDGDAILLSTYPSDDVFADLDGSAHKLGVYLSRQRYAHAIDVRKLSNGKMCVGVMYSPVIYVEFSFVRSHVVRPGRYCVVSNWTLGRSDSAILSDLSEDFLSWASGVYSLVRKRAVRSEKVGIFRCWFLPEADETVRSRDGEWGTQAEFLTNPQEPVGK